MAWVFRSNTDSYTYHTASEVRHLGWPNPDHSVDNAISSLFFSLFLAHCCQGLVDHAVLNSQVFFGLIPNRLFLPNF